MSRRPRLHLPRAAVLACATLALTGAGVALANTIPSQPSQNWAGWVATATRSSRLASHFTTVAGSWVQPSAKCTPRRATFAAFWVGLGGYSLRSKALEQIGSEADCSSRGQLFYYAWYELVPRPPVTITSLRITPGDVISATVHVSSGTVTVTLTDQTSGAKPFRKTTFMHSPSPDTSAAEWIAEAPSNCNSHNRCKPLRLTDFGQVGFTAASAVSIGSAGRHGGPISDPAWDYGQIVLSSDGKARYSPNEKSYALPSALNLAGTAFTVSYGPAPTGPTGPTGSTGSTASTGSTGSSGSTGATGATA